MTETSTKERIKALEAALIWCSGSADFQTDGKARGGWEKICQPLLLNADGVTPAHDSLTTPEGVLAAMEGIAFRLHTRIELADPVLDIGPTNPCLRDHPTIGPLVSGGITYRLWSGNRDNPKAQPKIIARDEALALLREQMGGKTDESN